MTTLLTIPHKKHTNMNGRSGGKNKKKENPMMENVSVHGRHFLARMAPFFYFLVWWMFRRASPSLRRFLRSFSTKPKVLVSQIF